MQISARLQELLDRRVLPSQSRVDGYEEVIGQCPGVDPNLIVHLKQVFTKGGIKPAHPQLAQLLQIQYGIDLLIDYLEARFEHQTAKARQNREV